MMDRRKIAVVDPASHVLPYDFFYIEELVKRGYSVEFYGSYTAYNADYLDALRTLDVPVHLYRISRTSAPRWRALVNYSLLLVHLLLGRYRWIHFQAGIAIFLELPFLMLLRKRIIRSVHDDVPHGSNRRIDLSLLLFAVLARRLVFLSQFVMRRFARNYPEKIYRKGILIPHGITPIGKSPNEAIINLTTLERAVVFVGRVQRYKGIEIFEHLVEKLKGEELAFEIHGKWDSSLSGTKARLADLGVIIRDTYLSHDDLSSLLMRRPIFILPYTGGSQSGVFYALLAYSHLMVASTACDSGEVLGQISGVRLTFSPGDATGAAEAIRQVLARHEQASIAIQHIRDKHRWDVAMLQIGRIYDD